MVKMTPMDMRIMKIEYTNESSKNSIRTYYSYDAQGNVMATYERTILANFQGGGATSDYTDKYVLSEQMHTLRDSATIPFQYWSVLF